MSTKIPYCTKTWSPTTGCTPLSDGCLNCYAAVMARRLQAMGTRGYERGFEPTCHPERLEQPLKWRKPRRVLTCSMGDLFHEEVPVKFIERVWEVILQADQHQFLVLTKRPGRLADVYPWFYHWNIWMGVTIENQQEAWRLDKLKEWWKGNIWLSCEPLLGPLELDLEGVGWVVVGGESGPGARPMDLDWARDIIRQCREVGVKAYVKQMGSHWTHYAGDKFGVPGSKGQNVDAWPEDLRIREFPEGLLLDA